MPEGADIVLHYLAMMRAGTAPVTPVPETPNVGFQRNMVMHLSSDARRGEPVTREEIMDTCEAALSALDRLAYALAGAIMRGDAYSCALSECLAVKSP